MSFEERNVTDEVLKREMKRLKELVTICNGLDKTLYNLLLELKSVIEEYELKVDVPLIVKDNGEIYCTDKYGGSKFLGRLNRREKRIEGCDCYMLNKAVSDFIENLYKIVMSNIAYHNSRKFELEESTSKLRRIISLFKYW